ncbi:hypothetical protein P691DRAFT_782189 [Macrolepiota fuliginosa MF-IS2]|uniref:Uncharacterized protein n=1 Tax=Macrolepiota fuliginosa MF-IS2 TaxID=1400762 RepID=A0A9P5WWW4_9AGAR|nr:hypothetical protein P691DRAFT_782189 [Macrolepiota fuliginosa MF-IS2]
MAAHIRRNHAEKDGTPGVRRFPGIPGPVLSGERKMGIEGSATAEYISDYGLPGSENPTVIETTSGLANRIVQLQAPLDSLKPLTCLDTQGANIYLYALVSTRSCITIWQNGDFTVGSVTVDLMPRWWNSTASTNLQLGIVPFGQAPFQVSSPLVQSLRPLVPILHLAIPLLLQDISDGSAKQATQKTRRLSIGKRMSTIATNWGSIAAAGANAIRNSMAVSGSTASSFSFGGMRPASGFALDDGAGSQAGIDEDRRGIAQSTGGERMSRVSFADGVRQSRVSFASEPGPSGESRRTRAFHHDYVPPVPSISAGVTAASPNDEDGALSPRQTHGPLALTPEDIRACIATGSQARSASNASTPSAATTQQKDEIDNVLPALSMMRTDQGEDHLIPAPAPAHTHPTPPSSIPSPPPTMMSPVMATMSLPMPASIMSPDEMLRAYAERRSTRTMTPVNGVSYPMPVASPMSPTMSMPMPMPMSPPPTMAMVTPLPMSPVNTGKR